MRTELKEGTDAKTKTAAALTSLFMIADKFIDPPTNSSASSGAPHVATMDR